MTKGFCTSVLILYAWSYKGTRSAMRETEAQNSQKTCPRSEQGLRASESLRGSFWPRPCWEVPRHLLPGFRKEVSFWPSAQEAGVMQRTHCIWGFGTPHTHSHNVYLNPVPIPHQLCDLWDPLPHTQNVYLNPVPTPHQLCDLGCVAWPL